MKENKDHHSFWNMEKDSKHYIGLFCPTEKKGLAYGPYLKEELEKIEYPKSCPKCKNKIEAYQ